MTVDDQVQIQVIGKTETVYSVSFCASLHKRQIEMSPIVCEHHIYGIEKVKSLPDDFLFVIFLIGKELNSAAVLSVYQENT